MDTQSNNYTTLEQIHCTYTQPHTQNTQHHSYRSYLGFVCLMQISTRNHDYLIDTLELRHHMHILLDPFTNPDIVKVWKNDIHSFSVCGCKFTPMASMYALYKVMYYGGDAR